MAKRHLTARQVRYLWAVGAFRRKSGTKRGVKYDADKARAARGRKTGYKGKERIRNAQGRTIGRQAAGTSTYRRKTGRAANTRHNHHTNAVNRGNPYGNGRMVIGGKTAGLRGGGKTRLDYSTTRAQRIAAGQGIANLNVTRHPDGTLSLKRNTFRMQGTREGVKYVSVNYRNNPQSRLDRYNAAVKAKRALAETTRAARTAERRMKASARLNKLTAGEVLTRNVARVNAKASQTQSALQSLVASGMSLSAYARTQRGKKRRFASR